MEHLLILARYEHGTGLAMEQDLPLTPLLRQAADEVHRTTGAEITLTTPDWLTIDGDPIALERAITNLIRNGVQAGGAPVHINAQLYGDYVEVTVTDHGKGIPSSELSHLFEPFWRGDPARSRTGGVGLGLAIVKTVVDAHRGHIEVKSESDQGTVFILQLPHRKTW